MSPASILVIEDDPNLRLALGDNLLAEGYAVRTAATGAEARAELAAHAFDLLVLDVMLPDEDGYALCRWARGAGVRSRVLMLTARTLEEDVVRGFDAGAQDYLGKPYRLRELLARVRALLRRDDLPTAAAPALRFGDWVLDEERREVRGADGRAVDLTRTEFDLLRFFLRNADRALTRDAILDAVWGTEVVVDTRTVDNFVSSLKRKLGWTSRSGWLIHTLRGVGYRMELARTPGR